MIYNCNMASEAATTDAGGTVQEVSITLMDGEDVSHNIRPSLAVWLSSTRDILLTLFTLGIWAAVGYIVTRSHRYVVTSERVVKKTGILSKSTKEYRYEDIQSINTGKKLIERLLGAGNIQFETGAGGSTITFLGVPDHDEVANTIRNYLRD